MAKKNRLLILYYVKLFIMKKYIFIPTLILGIFVSCKKDKPIITVPNPEILLKGGTWQLTKFKSPTGAWKDSVGIFYKFTSDTTILTNRNSPPCDGKYDAINSSGLKTITCTFWYCKPSANHAFSIESIEGNNMTIFYSDEIAGNIIQLKEQYVRQ